jgi:hypothetical protein
MFLPFFFLKDGVNYIPDLSNMTITREALRKIIRVIQLPYFISKRPVEERVEFEAPTSALDTVATDLCNLVCFCV